MSKAPQSKLNAVASPPVISTTPVKLTAIPPHRLRLSRSFKKAIANKAVKIGAVFTNKLVQQGGNNYPVKKG